MTMPPLLAIAAGRRARPRKAPQPMQSELSLHIDVVNLLRRFSRPDWLWFHPANGEKRNGARAGAKLRAMGVRPGVADLILVGPGGRLRCLEFKRRDGRLSDEQREFAAWCAAHDVPHAIVRSIGEALATFEQWGCLRIKVKIGGAR
ncbi:MAG TPA: VRR-NUC domain-containing protein [Methylovirgula sp.]|nr:VRR-NUC domain-containing protein [Methylovirgula sp.]